MQREVIQHALGSAAAEGADARDVASGTVGAVKGLLAELQPLVGELAARALYGRALHLAKSSFDRPAAAGEPVADLLGALQQDLAARSASDARAAAGALLHAFADLLTSLIGLSLTNRILRTAWGVPSMQPLSEDPAP